MTFMKILFYLNRYPAYGGIETVTTQLANYFVQKKYEVSIFSFVAMEERLLMLLDRRIEWILAKDSKNIDCLENVLQFQKILSESSFDFILFQDSYAPIERLLFKVNAFSRYRVILVEHNTPNAFLKDLNASLHYFHGKDFVVRLMLYPIYYVKRYLFVSQRIRKLYKVCYKYVLLSDCYYSVWERLTHIRNHPKLLYVNNPLTVQSINEFIANKEKVCLFAARLTEQKGTDKIIRIWRKIEKKHPDWSLIILGDGSQKNNMQEMVKFLGMKYVFFEGFKTNVVDYYRKAAILCMTSIYEGWPLSLTEAMAYSCLPMTFNSYASASDIISDGTNGCLITPFDEDEYVSRLSELMDDKEKLLKMRKAAFEYSRTKEISIIGEKWFTVMK